MTSSVTNTIRRLLDRIGIAEPPVDLDCVARHQGVHAIEEVSMGTLFGSTTRTEHGFDITLSDSQPYRRRFTLAHEIAHTILDSKRSALGPVGMRKPDTYNRIERRCDRLAAELLMPNHMFQPRVLKAPASIQTIKDLAELFDASIESAAVRYSQLNPYQVRVVVWDVGEEVTRVKWARGKGLRDSPLQRGSEWKTSRLKGVAHALRCEHTVAEQESLGRVEVFGESASFGSDERRYVLSIFRRPIPNAQLKGRRILSHKECRS